LKGEILDDIFFSVMALIWHRRESKLQCKGCARVKAMLLYFEETNCVCLFVCLFGAIWRDGLLLISCHLESRPYK